MEIYELIAISVLTFGGGFILGYFTADLYSKICALRKRKTNETKKSELSKMQ